MTAKELISVLINLFSGGLGGLIVLWLGFCYENKRRRKEELERRFTKFTYAYLSASNAWFEMKRFEREHYQEDALGRWRDNYNKFQTELEVIYLEIDRVACPKLSSSIKKLPVFDKAPQEDLTKERDAREKALESLSKEFAKQYL